MKLCYFILIILVPSSLFALDNTPKLSNDIMMITMSKGPKFVSSDNKPVNHEPEILVMESEKEPETSNEVVGGTQPHTFAAGDATIRSSPRPEERPSDLNTKPVATEAKASTPNLYDMKGCQYHRNYSTSNSRCYKSMTTVERAERIMKAANYVNKLHKTKFDGRYMLCTGWRESNFNPGASNPKSHGGSDELGMFQVTPGTWKPALAKGVLLPEFKNMSTSKYIKEMANSTVAQVELSFLVLKMKLDEYANTGGTGQITRERVLSGRGDNNHYWQLARRYNGKGPKAERYANKISSCYKCLKGKMSAEQTNLNTDIQRCLGQAKD